MYRVLIIEDDPMVAMINEQYCLKNSDFTVCGSCRNGQEGLEFLENNQVDLVLLDVYMPIMDGREILKKIREKKINTEIIMVTAANDTATLEETMHLGVIDYLIKPFAFDRFQVALQKFDSKYKAMHKASVVDQNFIDSFINSSSKTDEVQLPKGIQKKTLELIKSYFNEREGWQSGDMIAGQLGISIVTIRHYMNYLCKTGFVKKDVNYSTGGRPCMLFKKI